TTMKISLKPLALSLAASLALTASAQGSTPTSSGMTVTPASGSAYGLLGQSYMGVNFGYLSLDDGPPDVGHSFGFVANRPTEVTGVDASFKYNYTTMSASGLNVNLHEFAVGATGYVALAGVKPFAEANVGWGFMRGSGGYSRNSFSFLLGAGVEIQVGPRVALSPYFNYQEFTRFGGSGTWNYGLKAAVRIVQQFSATAAVELDDDQNITYRFGLNRHF
ncbi:MAG: hypothetical protein ABIO94_04640, partial [Opitutaceae bacterium]